MTLDCSRIAKKIAMLKGVFAGGRRQTLLYSSNARDKYKKVQKIFRLQNSPYFCVFKYAPAVKQKVWNEAENRERDWGETLKIRKLVGYCPKQGDHRNKNKVDRNTPITSKHVSPKRSAKMIDGTGKPKIPPKFAKRAARYNRFGYKPLG